MMAMHDRIPEQALEWHGSGGSVMATVVQTWGSAPRPVGSQAVISHDGRIAGSVSGGCVEGAIIAEAGPVLAESRPRILEFGVADEDAFAVGLACGGRIRIIVEPVGGAGGLPVLMLEELIGNLASRKPVALAVDTDGWNHMLLGADDEFPGLQDRLRLDRSGFEGAWFLNVFNPPLRLIVIGAVHIAQPLVELAGMCGYDVSLVDPRETFATTERFPGIDISHDWPDDAIQALQPDSRTAVVTLTHDPKIDDAALLEIIDSDVFYIGSLGSRRTHQKRCERLGRLGIARESLARINAPVGLDIGASGPGEIAVSIMAELTQALRRGG